MNSYKDILLITGPLKTGCAKCEAKKLPICACPKDGLEEDETKENFSEMNNKISSEFKIILDNVVSDESNLNEDIVEVTPQLIINGSEKRFQFTLGPGVSLKAIKQLLQKFIEELGENPGVSCDESQDNTLSITITKQKYFVMFINQLCEKNLILMQDNQKLENLISEKNVESLYSNPFTMTLKPY